MAKPRSQIPLEDRARLTAIRTRCAFQQPPQTSLGTRGQRDFYEKAAEWYGDGDKLAQPTPSMRTTFPRAARPERPAEPFRVPPVSVPQPQSRLIVNPDVDRIARVIQQNRKAQTYSVFYMFVVGEKVSQTDLRAVSRDHLTNPHDCGLFFTSANQQQEFLQALADKLAPGVPEVAIAEVGRAERGISGQPEHRYVTIRRSAGVQTPVSTTPVQVNVGSQQPLF